MYLVPVDVTVDLDLEAVLSARPSLTFPIHLARAAIDEKSVKAQQIAERESWPDWR